MQALVDKNRMRRKRGFYKIVKAAVTNKYVGLEAVAPG
jgi:hypothetical protein